MLAACAAPMLSIRAGLRTSGCHGNIGVVRAKRALADASRSLHRTWDMRRAALARVPWRVRVVQLKNVNLSSGA